MSREYVQELPATQEAFQRLSALWEEIGPTKPSTETRKQQLLEDETRIVIDRSLKSESFADALKGKKQETLMVTVSKANISFTLTEKGLIELRIPRLDINIGGESFYIPSGLHFGVSDERITSPSPRDSFQGTSLALVGWLEEMVEENRYTNPPISMIPSGNHRHLIAA